MTAVLADQACSIPGCQHLSLPTDHLCLRHYRIVAKSRRDDAPWAERLRLRGIWDVCPSPSNDVTPDGECGICHKLVLTPERIEELRGRRILSAEHVARLHRLRDQERER